mmetsp:Transcript_9456/g.27669  ORF Transcript_9456/g.27669 Transcript_9456/m.27669 type:complete len:215 (+) Transcript_9456:247-891(+)
MRTRPARVAPRAGPRKPPRSAPGRPARGPRIQHSPCRRTTRRRPGPTDERDRDGRRSPGTRRSAAGGAKAVAGGAEALARAMEVAEGKWTAVERPAAAEPSTVPVKARLARATVAARLVVATAAARPVTAGVAAAVAMVVAVATAADPGERMARRVSRTAPECPCTRSRRSPACPDSTPSSHACSRPRSLQACLGPRGRHRTACTWRSARPRCQ